MLSKNIEGSIIKQRNPKKRKVLLSLAAIITLMILLSGPGCGNQWILFYDKPLKGYVVDAETKQPIDGVIVVAMWRLSQFLSQGFGGYAKVIEVKTDKEGNFKIPFWITFKPWKFNSAIHDLAPEIVIYKPGYKVYSSHKLMRTGFPEDTVMTPEEKRKIKEEYSFNPVKLKQIYTDEERVKNLNALENDAKLYDLIDKLNKKDSIVLIGTIKEEYLLLPQVLRERYVYIEQIERRLRGGNK